MVFRRPIAISLDAAPTPFRRARRCVCNLLLGIALATVTGLAGSDASAVPVISGFNFTGATTTNAGLQDAAWKVVASGPTAPSTLPYDAWIFSGGDPQNNVPTTWFPGDGAAGANAGAYGGRWIGLQQNDATALIESGTPGDTYSTIFATTFTASEAGVYDFWFASTADNFVTFFVNGTVFTPPADTLNPTITGGALLAQAGGLGSLKWISAAAPVQSGVNTLYAVVTDRANVGGAFGYTGLIVVPEPSTYAMGAIGIATIGFLRMGRRRAGRRG